MLNSNKETIKELREEIAKIRKEQMDFIIHTSKIMQTVLDNDKRKFMYQIRQEDVELIKDGHKYRSIIKIID